MTYALLSVTFALLLWFTFALLLWFVASRLDEDEDVLYYVLLRAADRFYAEWNRYPGYYEDTIETDIPQMKVSLLLPGRFTEKVEVEE